MFKKFATRSREEEIMDDFSMEGDFLAQTLRQLETVNYWLGGTKTAQKGIATLLKNTKFSKSITIADLGCGSGDSLRAIAKWAKDKPYNFKLIGIDANNFIVKHAEKEANSYPNIAFKHQDILSPSCSFKGVDIVICGLFLHHFSDEEQVQILKKCKEHQVKALLINDLHRHWLAYYLFRMVCRIFRANSMIVADGSLSVLKSFRKEELKKMMQNVGITTYTIRWKWAFRFQVIAHF